MTDNSELREDLREIKSSLAALSAAVTELRVTVAGQYVTKRDFDKYQKEHSGHHKWLMGTVISVVGLFVTIIALALSTA